MWHRAVARPRRGRRRDVRVAMSPRHRPFRRFTSPPARPRRATCTAERTSEVLGRGPEAVDIFRACFEPFPPRPSREDPMSRRAPDRTLGLVAWALLLVPTLAAGATLPPPPADQDGPGRRDPERRPDHRSVPLARGQGRARDAELDRRPDGVTRPHPLERAQPGPHPRAARAIPQVDAVQAPIERGGKLFSEAPRRSGPVRAHRCARVRRAPDEGARRSPIP